MVNITLSIPEELKLEMEEFKIMNWSEVARRAIKSKIEQLKVLESFTKESELTEEDALRLGKKVNEALSRKYNSSKRCK